MKQAGKALIISAAIAVLACAIALDTATYRPCIRIADTMPIAGNCR